MRAETTLSINNSILGQSPCRGKAFRTNKAFAGSNQESAAMFGTTNTSNKVAVLRKLPEMVMRREDVALPACQGDHSRCKVAELRAGPHSNAWGGRLS